MPQNFTKAKLTDAKKGYSNLQYFFWLVSGCEINILKDCPTDYNRQAGIGFTIFMTSVFAAFAGGYAGYYFSNYWLSALIFGMVWGALVFSIDRTLVVTLKKDPTRAKQPIWIPLVGRAILACLIAFIISIPLELLVFADQIKIQKQFDKQHAREELVTLMESSNRLSDKKQGEKDARQRAKDAEQAALDCNNAPGYSETFTHYQKVSAQLESAERIHNDYYNQYRAIIKHDSLGAKEYINGKKYQDAYNRWTLFKSRERALSDSLSGICNSFKAQKRAEANESSKTADRIKGVVSHLKDTIDNSGQNMEKMFDDSFIRDFVALENAAYDTQTRPGKPPVVEYKNGSLLFLLWLIRILFFVIEILPTIAKIATPIGEYDWAIYQMEQDFIKELEIKTNGYLEQQEKLRETRYQEERRQADKTAEVEGDLHDDLLKDIAQAQSEVGKHRIEEFKRKHIK